MLKNDFHAKGSPFTLKLFKLATFKKQ